VDFYLGCGRRKLVCGRLQSAQGTQNMTWDQVLYNVIAPVGMALVLGIGGILAAKIVARQVGKD
jgi:hypothetical protein